MVDASCLESQHLSSTVDSSWGMEPDLWVWECFKQDPVVDSSSVSGLNPYKHFLVVLFGWGL